MGKDLCFAIAFLLCAGGGLYCLFHKLLLPLLGFAAGVFVVLGLAIPLHLTIG